MYPNPATDFIEFNGDLSTNSGANIYSLDGKLIRKSDLKSGKIHVTDLSPSAYFIELSGNKTYSNSVKFIKK
ncbi:T9SS type A sorting domain-containing protein [Chryseobacterium kimseyorum]|uniref:T9SS type A sorting domain-containing protein n=1 Tax=Chryseobacterium kimseyorum TaxID=2984028 RepID=UPI003873AB14